MKRILLLGVVVLVFAACEQTPSSGPAVREHAPSFAHENIDQAKAVMATIDAPNLKKGWERGVVLTSWCERKCGYQDWWFALVLGPRGTYTYIQSSEPQPLAGPRLNAFVGPGDYIAWDNHDGDQQITPPKEVRMIQKAG